MIRMLGGVVRSAPNPFKRKLVFQTPSFSGAVSEFPQVLIATYSAKTWTGLRLIKHWFPPEIRV